MKVKEDSEEASFSTLKSREPPRNQQNITSGAGTGSVPIARNNNTAALCREIRIVQDLIERCLQLFLDKDEVVKTLFEQARIQPDFTRIVWNILEQENAEFFKAYCTKLILKKQISMFNELLEKHHHLLNYAAPLEYPLAPMQEGIQHMPVDNLHNGYTLLQQHPIPSTVHSHIDSMGTFFNYDLVYENPESGNFCSAHMNYGGWMPIDNTTAHIAPTQPFIKSESPSPVSVASLDQYPFVPREMPESMDPSSFAFAELSRVRSPGQVLLQPANAGFNNLADIGEYSFSTGLRDPSEQNDNVDKFFADTIPATHS
ncbi:PREDICTED: uncharacterized protein LOC105109011 isoform X1 [Populus euphratica]|uniref:Uncharacterized protein LOC105109011 isoform X1 n=1 Tax=Populus euphratica TaxID=75702 RepID=A0AAJ6SZK6_POPEU|nr:PREDICTED: uncharacterized protein LOC105109011 isoform X1 [Populus euphratica]XP_011001877.1 PREDICTED: uncharacterized protein LOC105109011 isoform X1 [Populus euphratica]XP_011001878.1 PREDICTED: uncharacterized protein LOC105109011 isoform X1 [Populus euphratica]XP_011001879.1 PREDICTED: uncharacterized protein LOC105109011 isoform X1 [Populus euphratica]